MKRAYLLLLLNFTFSHLFADNSVRKEAEILLNTTGMDTVLEQSLAHMLDLQLNQNPELAPYKHVMLKFLNKHMSYESLKADIIEIYASAFTASELREINAFYRTPTGVKTIKLLPELMAKGGQIGAQRVHANIQELQEMFKAESERIQQQQIE